MKKLLGILCLASMVMTVACQNPEKELEEEIGAYLAEVENVGLSCVVVKDNQIVYNHNFGVKDLETQEPVDDNTIFRIASISKSFTGTSIMQLIDKGVLHLKDNVSDLVGFPVVNPNFPEDTITLEMLLSHTSSITDHEGYFTIDVINPATNENFANCYSTKQPGTTYRYCNLNLNLAGTILERYSGERFDQYVVNHILKPMELYGGYCVDSLDASRFAHLYEVVDATTNELVRQDSAYLARSEEIANYTMGHDAPIFSPTGGMKISALDLARYMMMHMNYGMYPLKDSIRIIPEALARDMQVPRSFYSHKVGGPALTDSQSDEPDKVEEKIVTENYCITLWRTNKFDDEVEMVGHTGGAYGLCSAMFFNPEEKYGFVVISSGSKGSSVHNNVVSMLYRHFIKGNEKK